MASVYDEAQRIYEEQKLHKTIEDMFDREFARYGKAIDTNDLLVIFMSEYAKSAVNIDEPPNWDEKRAGEPLMYDDDTKVAILKQINKMAWHAVKSFMERNGLEIDEYSPIPSGVLETLIQDVERTPLENEEDEFSFAAQDDNDGAEDADADEDADEDGGEDGDGDDEDEWEDADQSAEGDIEPDTGDIERDESGLSRFDDYTVDDINRPPAGVLKEYWEAVDVINAARLIAEENTI